MFIPSWLKLIILIIVIIVGGSLALQHQQETAVAHTPTLTSYLNNDHSETILVFDLNANQISSYEEFLKGEDGILVIHSDANSGEHVHDLINGQQILAEFVKRNGHISQSNKIYHRMEVLTLDQSNHLKPKFMSLNETGIRAIYIDSQYLSPKALTDPEKLDYKPGTILMADGSTRLIQDIKIYNFFPKNVLQTKHGG